MNRKIFAGLAAGLVGGLAFDGVMRVMPLADRRSSMIAFAADAVHAHDPLVGWFVYPLYAILLGGLFGWLLERRTLGRGRGALVGALYGLACWLLAELFVIPMLFLTPPMSIAAIDEGRAVAVPLVAGHVVYGVVLGLTWSWITRPPTKGRRPRAAPDAARRAA